MPATSLDGPVVALTGTPGTGKTHVADSLKGMGHAVVDLSRFVGDARFDVGRDTDRDSVMMDEEALDAYLVDNLVGESGARNLNGPVFIDSHFAHNLRLVDRIVVLRCRPGVLRERLARRGYSEEKIRENLEAEGMDLILQESLEWREEQAKQRRRVAVAQVDNTSRDPEETARIVALFAQAASANLEIEPVDWSDEVLGWY